MRRQFELSNDLAAGLAGEHDAMLRALEERLAARVYLRGNLLTLDGEPAALETGARVIAELGMLAPSGHTLDEATLSAVIGVLIDEGCDAAGPLDLPAERGEDLLQVVRSRGRDVFQADDLGLALSSQAGDD